MNNFGILLKSMFRNKLRFGADATKRKKIGFSVMFGLAYVMIVAILLLLIISMRDFLTAQPYSPFPSCI